MDSVRLVMALALVVAMLAACGGGAAQPIKVAPGVTQAPTSDPAAPRTPLPTYTEGY